MADNPEDMLGQLTNAMRGAQESANSTADSLNRMRDANNTMYGDLSGNQERLTDAMRRATKPAQAVAEIYRVLRGVQYDSISDIQKLLDETKRHTRAGEEDIITLKAQSELLMQIAKFNNATIATHKGYGTALDAVRKGLGALSPQMEKVFAGMAGKKGVGALATGALDAIPQLGGLLGKLDMIGTAAMGVSVLITGLIWAFQAAMKTIRGGMDVNKQFIATMGASNVGFLNSIELFSRMGFEANLYGASTEEAMKTLQELTASQAINTQTFRDSRLEIIQQVGKVTALGKVMNMTSEETAGLVTSLTRMGVPVQRLEEGFMGAYKAAASAYLTMKQFSGVMAALAPVSMYTAQAAQNTEGLLGKFANALRVSNDPLAKMISATGNIAQFSQTMTEAANAAARMDLSQLMAVVGAKGPYTNITDMMGSALAPQEGRMQQMVDLLTMVGEATTNVADKTGTMAIFAQKGLGMTSNSAYMFAALSRDLQAAQTTGRMQEAQNIKDQMGKLAETAAASAALQDPIKYIAQLMERVVGILTGISARIMGSYLLGGGGTVPMVPSGMGAIK